MRVLRDGPDGIDDLVAGLKALRPEERQKVMVRLGETVCTHCMTDYEPGAVVRGGERCRCWKDPD